MKKPFDNFIITIFLLLVFAGGIAIFFSPLFFPGFTEAQTAELFLEPQNKRIRGVAETKAYWHGSDLFDDFVQLTDNFSKKEKYDFRVLAWFLNDMATTPFLAEASHLYGKKDLTQKILGALLLSKANQKHLHPDLLHFF